MSDTPRAQLIHIDVDRRLGHEWDEWDGRPLPNGGDFDSAPSLFFGWAALALVTATGIASELGRIGLVDPELVPGAIEGAAGSVKGYARQ